MLGKEGGVVEIHEAKEKAQQDLYEAISAEVANVSKIGSTAARAQTVADLARAYRYAAGGAQPGAVTVEK
ncbi:hypothetical protein [uncultured Microbacterium sp.]|uniref:hypothetical protein n=1 Tax=uncultured Microbacterium sp. TaxID=191216 RepID=UPI003748E005